jgi:DNA-binding IclR family transcriptional regulator
VLSTIALDERWLRIVRAEFLEMPGLRLTLAQACRLWGLPPDTTRALLAELVAEGLLRRTADGTFCRADLAP